MSNLHSRGNKLTLAHARGTLLGLMLAVGALVSAGHIDVARTQTNSVNVGKELCSPNPTTCGVSSVSLNTPIFYNVSLANLTTSASTIDLQETFQPGFNFIGATCGGVNLTANPQLGSGGGTTFLGPVSLPASSSPGAAGQTVTCTISGYFSNIAGATNNAGNTATVVAHANHTNILGTSNSVNAIVDPNAPIPTDLSITKTVTPTAVDVSGGPQTVHYTITVANNGPNDVYLGSNFQLQDRLALPATGVPLSATFVSGVCISSNGSDCLNPVPDPASNHSPATIASTSWSDFVQWMYPAGSPGLLRAGGTIQLTYDMTIGKVSGIQCIKQVGGDFLLNEAHIGLNLPGASNTTIRDTQPGNNTSSSAVQVTTGATVVVPGCGAQPAPLIDIQKSQLAPLPSQQPANGFPWPQDVKYEIRIKNLSTVKTISNIQLSDPSNNSLGDLVSEGFGTPPFTARLIHGSCSTGVCSGSSAPPGNVQNLLGYNDTKWMFATRIYAQSVSQLAPGQTAILTLTIRYSNPGCDSYPSVRPKPVINFVRATYQDVLQGTSIPTTVQVRSNDVITLMEAPAPCKFQVTKSVNDTHRIIFGSPRIYTVTYRNLDTQVRTVGTLIDVMRTTPNYATQLPVDYSYTCVPSTPGSVAGFPGNITPVTGTALVVGTSLPQQGVRIIQNTTPVVFQPQASLTCTVTVKVRRPPVGDPYCSTSGALENVAIMDTSNFYNSNLPWPANSLPGNSSPPVSLPLPKCLNLVVNKRVGNLPPPPWTTVNGGPIDYLLTVTNKGDPIHWNPNLQDSTGPILTDTFSPATYHAVSPVSTSCAPANPACLWAWRSSPTSNPSHAAIARLDTGQSVSTQFRVLKPYPQPPPNQLCNTVKIAMSGPDSGDWYANDPTTLTANLCVPILEMSSLTVTKSIINQTAGAPPSNASFPITVDCQPYGPYNQSFNLSASAPSQTVPNIPVGFPCTVTEGQLPAPVVSTTCQSGLAGWALPTYSPTQTVVIQPRSNALQTVVVQNTYSCNPGCAPPPLGMVAWWPMTGPDNDGNTNDIAPQPGSVVNNKAGSPVYHPVVGKVGGSASALFFGHRAVVANEPELDFGTGDFSADAWIRIVTVGPMVILPIADKYTVPNGPGFVFYVRNQKLELKINGTTFVGAGPSMSFADPDHNSGPWYHVAVTVQRSPSLVVFYINGNQAGTFTPVPSASVNSGSDLWIGGTHLMPGAAQDRLAIDELELFKRVLTQAEVQLIFSAGSAGKCRP